MIEGHDMTFGKNMMALSLGLGAALLAAQAAQAAGGRNCGPHQDVVERLAGKFGENRRSIALAANNSVIEVFASDETGSWTITATAPGGPTCLIASGQAYQQLADILPNTNSGA